MGFKNDKLGREQYADFLTKIIINSENYKRISDSESMVIAIDSSWGTGKTTFLDMWKEKLEKKEEDFAVIKYNAWKNDFVEEPLESIIYNIIQHKMFYIDKEKSAFKESTKEILKCVEKIIKAYIKNKVRNSIGEEVVDAVGDIVETISEGTENIAEISQKGMAEISSFYEEYENYNNAVNLIKKLLAKAAEKIKIVVIIDELDRCKPLFAIKLLENIKHILDAKNVTFVFALDMAQLSHSIKCIYGQGMDSNGYLCRFFDYISKMPKADKKKYVSSLLEDNRLIRKQFVKVNSNYSVNNITIEELFCDIIDRFNLSLRDINTIYNNFLIFENINLKCTDNYSAYYLYLFLITLKYKRIDIYNKIFLEKQDISQEAIIKGYINEKHDIEEFIERIKLDEKIVDGVYEIEDIANSYSAKILKIENNKVVTKESWYNEGLEITNQIALSKCLFCDDLLKWNDIKNKKLIEYIQEKLEFFNFEYIVDENTEKIKEEVKI